MPKRATIIVAPRERFSSVSETLDELYMTISDADEIVVVEGGSPRSVRAKLQRDSDLGRIRWLRQPGPVLPNIARNIGVRYSSAPYVVFVDNDIRFEPGWLDALVARAENDNADVVAPLICIGPPRAVTIHHAGGVLIASTGENGVAIREQHRLMNVPVHQFDPIDAPAENTVSEFHCFLARKAFLEKTGPLDERLITREQMDFALRAMVHRGVVRFERDAVVTYFAGEDFSPSDLRYHLFRWSDRIARYSIDSFQQSWGVQLDAERIRFQWIARHRERAIRSAFPLFSRFAPGRIFRLFLRLLERRSDVLAQAAIVGMVAAQAIPESEVTDVMSRLETASGDVPQNQ